jgi:hypothetical protein
MYPVSAHDDVTPSMASIGKANDHSVRSDLEGFQLFSKIDYVLGHVSGNGVLQMRSIKTSSAMLYNVASGRLGYMIAHGATQLTCLWLTV